MAKKTRKFKTEVQQLLDLVIHSLYSKKEIFLRELISNASDACDRLRFESLTQEDLTSADTTGKIRLTPDSDARTLTISDNGIGMSQEELETNIGTIANSGTKQFIKSLKEAGNGADAELIGQFGVGFYASFMVADKVTVITRRAGTEQALRWESAGSGSYTLEDAERDSHGTDVILHLHEDAAEYLEEYRLRQIVRQYSDYISYPVVMDVEREEKPEEEGAEPVKKVEEETLNSMKAIWRKAKSDVTEEEYNEFYSHISHDYTPPAMTIHYAAEGATEFRALLYIPAHAPFDLFLRDAHKGVQLYVRNVLITDDCKELLPEYMRFVKGVVDSSDLPLNVSREMLQDDAVIRQMRKGLISKILSTLNDQRKKDPDAYRTFFGQFGRVLKEGVHMDYENGKKLHDLLLFPSTKSEEGKPVSLRDYIDRMPEGQSDIYFLPADSLEAAKHSPHLEVFTSKDYEVLFFVDPIDEWVAQALTEYDGKKLRSIDRGTINLDGEDTEEGEDAKAKTEAFGDLLTHIQKQLDEDVKEVRFSTRLTDSACCLVTDEHGMNPTMERMMRAMNQEVPASKRILELNQDHPIVERLGAILKENPEDPALTDGIDLLYGQALVAEGSPVKNPSRFARLVSSLMVGTLPSSEA